MSIISDSDLLTPDEASRFLRVPPITLSRWRKTQGGPPYVRLSRQTIRYRRRDLESFLHEITVTPAETPVWTPDDIKTAEA